MQRTLLRRHQARRQLDSDRCFTKPLVEPLEERALLTATLSPITGVQLISLSPIVEFNGQRYFSGNDGTHGFELWRSDGTQAGTVMVKEIRSGSSGAYPKNLTNVNGTLFFTAIDDQHGEELWKTDGTAEGTMLVKDISPGAISSLPDRLVSANDKLFFSLHGQGLWKSDGTETGTVLVKDLALGDDGGYIAQFTNVNGTLFFPVNDASGIEVWKSDGTTAGTTILKDLYPAGSSYPRYLTNVNGKVFFATAIDTFELWKSDGTAGGTTQIATIPRPATPIAATGGSLYFTVGGELWKSDGTAGGTGKAAFSSAVSGFASLGDTLYISSFGSLWKVHGSEPVTLVKDGLGGGPMNLTSVSGTLYFSSSETFASIPPAPPTLGIAIWKSNGAVGSAEQMVKSALITSPARGITVTNGNLLFQASGSTANGLWSLTIVNSAPTFAKGPDQSVTYKAAAQGVANFATAISPGVGDDGQTLAFIVENDNNSLFDVQPAIDATGRLTYTPKLGATGTAIVTVTLHDSGGTANGGVDTSQPQTFQITIRPPGPLHRLEDPLNVDEFPEISSIDALYIINYINAFGPGPVDLNLPHLPPFLDTSGDDFISAGDAVLVINHINAYGLGPRPDGEAQSPGAFEPALGPTGVANDLAALLAFDQVAGTTVRRQRGT